MEPVLSLGRETVKCRSAPQERLIASSRIRQGKVGQAGQVGAWPGAQRLLGGHAACMCCSAMPHVESRCNSKLASYAGGVAHPSKLRMHGRTRTLRLGFRV